MTYSADYGRGGPGGDGAWEDPRSATTPLQRRSLDPTGRYADPSAAHGFAEQAPADGRDPHPSFGERFSGADPYNDARFGPSFGDSRGQGQSGSYGNVGQRGAAGDDYGRQPQSSFGYNAGGGHRAGPGDLVGDRYELIDLVGKGGNGSVWRANDTVLRREVGLKEVFLPQDLPPAERDQLIDRSRREAQIAAGLSHPSVIRVFDVVEHAGLPWIVMELLQSRSLADILSQDGPLPTRVAAKIGLALVGALQAAHDAGIIHRDVKPGNVLISTDGRCVLSDFGAAQMNQVSGGTTPGKVLGSAHYIAPERAIGHPAEAASDVFSLGVTLYAAVEGRPPFDRGDAISTMRAVVQEPPENPRNAGPLTALLGGMLAKEPDQRYTLAQVRSDLAGLLAGELAGDSGPMPVRRQRPPEAADRGATSGLQQVAPKPGPNGDDGAEGMTTTKKALIALMIAAMVATLVFGLYQWRSSIGDDDAAEDPAPTSEASESTDDTDGGGDADDEDDAGEGGGEAAFATATHDGGGFSANYPAEWGEGLAEQDFATFFNTEDDSQWVRFYGGSDRGMPDPQAYLADFFATGLDDTSGTEQVRLEPVELDGLEGTVLEYTGTDIESGVERHSVWAIVDAGDGTSFGVFVAGPESSWDLSRQVYEEALRSFATG